MSPGDRRRFLDQFNEIESFFSSQLVDQSVEEISVVEILSNFSVVCLISAISSCPMLVSFKGKDSEYKQYQFITSEMCKEYGKIKISSKIFTQNQGKFRAASEAVLDEDNETFPADGRISPPIA